jgi:HlyD family secretion protein
MGEAPAGMGERTVITGEMPAGMGERTVIMGGADSGIPEGYMYVIVETGVSNDTYVEIISGLNEGDEILYRGASADAGFGNMMMWGSPGMGAPSGGTYTVTGPGGGGGGGTAVTRPMP